MRPGSAPRVSFRISMAPSRYFCVLLFVTAWLRAASWTESVLNVPNGSFESPSTFFVSVYFDAWQKTPEPTNAATGGYTWVQETGVFLNTDPGQPNHIVNCDGQQAAWLFSVSGVGFFQDYDSLGGTNTHPDHAFGARFEVGKSYRLIVGIDGGLGSSLFDGATLQLQLYYRDNAGKMVTIASNEVVHSSLVFVDHIHFIDFTVDTPVVSATDAWADKHAGIQVISTVSTDLRGGYWNIDNVRLLARQPVAPGIQAVLQNDHLHLAWLASSGCLYQVQRSTLLGMWKDIGLPIAGIDGPLTFDDAVGTDPMAWYRVLVSPGP